MSYSYNGKSDVDVNDGTGSLSYSASSCVSDESSIPEDTQYLALFLEREQQLHVEEQKLARQSRSLKESPQRTGSGSTRASVSASVSASDSLDDDAGYQKFCRIRNNDNVSGQTSDSNRHDGGALSGDNGSIRRQSKKVNKLFSPATVTASDASLRSGINSSSRQSQHKQTLSDPKNEVWYERLLCGMNANC